MAYPPKTEARIKELERELAELKGERISFLPNDKTRELQRITHVYAQNFETRISYIARAVTAVEQGSSDVLCYGTKVKTSKDMNFEEVKVASKCASEICDILLKYAKKNFEVEKEEDNQCQSTQ